MKRHQKIGDGIVGIISYTGDITWIMMMSFPKDCTASLFARFAGFELDYDSPDMGDVVGEMANILAGNIVGCLQEKGIKCAMSLPTLVRGYNVEPMPPRDLPSKKLIVTMPEGIVIVNVVGAKPGMFYGQSSRSVTRKMQGDQAYLVFWLAVGARGRPVRLF